MVSCEISQCKEFCKLGSVRAWQISKERGKIYGSQQGGVTPWIW